MTLLQRALVVCMLWSLCAARARADDTSDLQSLLDEQVIVTAASTAQRESSAPALSTTITADDLKAFGFRTIGQAIDFLSLGVFTGDPLRTPDIGSRGILFENDNGKHFLLQINGHAINDPLYGAARFDAGAGIPIDLVDHIEVVLGPGSVLYGSNAMMGVINVITKDAAGYEGVHAFGETEFGRTFRVGASGAHAFKLWSVPSEVIVGAEFYDRYGPTLDFSKLTLPAVQGEAGADIPTSWGGPLERGYFTRAPSGHLRLRVGDLEVNVAANLYERGIPYASSYYYVNFNDGKSSEIDRALRVDIRHQATLSSLVQLTSRAYADSFDYQRTLNAYGIILCLSPEVKVCRLYDAGVARWVGVEERLTLNWLRDQTLVTALGVDVRERQVGAKQDQLDASTGMPINATTGRLDDDSISVGPYIQQTWNPSSVIDINAGARLDITDRFSAVLSPRGAVVLRPFDKTTFKAIYSQAFRAPTWSETSLFNLTVARSPGLAPERVRSIEGMAEQGIGTQRLRLSAFTTRWTDLIETAPLTVDEITRLQRSGELHMVVGSIVRSVNLSSIDNYGLSAGWQGSSFAGSLRYGANLTCAYARIHQGGQSRRIAAAPELFGNAHLAYRFGPNLPTVAFAVQAMSGRQADREAPNGDVLRAAPPIANLHLALTGNLPVVSALGYVLTADYLTAGHGPYTAGPDLTQSFTLTNTAALPTPGYAPLDEFRVMLGVRLDLLSGRVPETVETP